MIERARATVPATVVQVAARGAPAVCAPLAGVSGAAWMVEARGGARTVVRRASADEISATRAAEEVGVGPRVLAVIEDWLVVEWLAGQALTTLELARPTVLDGVADLLRRWHRCRVSLPPASMGAARAAYAAAAEVSPELIALVEAADRAERALPTAERVPAHLDVAANLVRTGQGLRLIDFEYAAAATPAQELGQLVWEGELGPEQADRLMDAYWEGGAGGSERSAVTAWTWISGVTWTAWASGRPELATYARRSWERVVGHWALPADVI